MSSQKISMQLLKRFGYYAIGLAFGLLIVLFIWNGKEVSFDYGMDARTLKTIRIKKRLFSADALNTLNNSKIST